MNHYRWWTWNVWWDSVQRGVKMGPLTVALFRHDGVWRWCWSLFLRPVYDGVAEALRRGDAWPEWVHRHGAPCLPLSTRGTLSGMAKSMTVTQAGRKGGKARASRLSPARRTEIARQAARARWQQRPSRQT